jgi:hypothetical protein
VPKVKGDPGKLKFVYLGGTELPSALMNNVIDALAQSPPSAEISEAAGKGYVLLPLGPRRSGGTHELSSRSSDGATGLGRAEPNSCNRCVTRGLTAGALYHSNPSGLQSCAARASLFGQIKLEDNVFDLAYSMIALAMPTWGNMNQEG